MDPYKKAGRLLLGLFVLNVVLVTTHLGEFWPAERHHELGEFWPFSIFPMFSRGGHPWVRSLVREVPDATDASLWQNTTLEAVPGTPYPLTPANINQNDISNFISKSKSWNKRRVDGMRRVFGDALRTKNLMIYRADGSIHDDSVSVVFTPFLLMAPDTTYFNPNLHYPTD